MHEIRSGPRIAHGLVASVVALHAAAALAQTPPNLLGFAQGALPLRVEADPATRTTMVHAVRAIDGAMVVYAFTAPVPPATQVAFVYELPAPTTFERLAVVNIVETPSPAQTFVRDVAVYGSATSPTEGFELLASGTLEAHRGKGQETALALKRAAPVRWIRLALSNGMDVRTPTVALEFSEIVGHGRQEAAALSTRFNGHWKGKGVALTMRQQGAVVSGCYDRTGQLEGTVSGSVLRATGTESATGVRSAFITSVGADASLISLRSTNGSPFALFTGEPQPANAAGSCQAVKTPSLGCGSVVHGIQFDFDSAIVRADSAPVLDALHAGLAAERSTSIRIEGHTSSEGDAAYNQRLSEQRARAVIDALVQRGSPRERLAAEGVGETRPIAPNDDESGRAMNRRVEVHCRG
jgi:OmpA-OmpF porin, OOP family